MNKKINTVLFLLGASLFNLVIMFLFMFIGFLLVGVVIREPIQPGSANLLFLLIFFLSIGGSFLLYHRVMRLISGKINFDAYFHPIVRFRKRNVSKTTEASKEEE